LYRKRDGARRLHEHCVLARFRYNDLKEAARAAESLRVVSEARWGKASARALCVGALSIQRLEGSRPCGGRGLYANSMMGRSVVELWRGCAAERDT
jgi:hypothetical protein